MSLIGNIIGYEDWESNEGKNGKYYNTLLNLTDEGYKYVGETMSRSYATMKSKGWKEEDGFADDFCLDVYLETDKDGIHLETVTKMKDQTVFEDATLSPEEEKYIIGSLSKDKDFLWCLNDLGVMDKYVGTIKEANITARFTDRCNKYLSDLEEKIEKRAFGETDTKAFMSRVNDKDSLETMGYIYIGTWNDGKEYMDKYTTFYKDKDDKLYAVSEMFKDDERKDKVYTVFETSAGEISEMYEFAFETQKLQFELSREVYNGQHLHHVTCAVDEDIIGKDKKTKRLNFAEFDNDKWANYITKVLDLNEYDSETLLHDLNNLRGDEWIEEVRDVIPDKAFKSFKKHVMNEKDIDKPTKKGTER